MQHTIFLLHWPLKMCGWIWTRLKKFLIKHRRLVGIFIPFIFFQFVWWSVCIRHNYFVEFNKRFRLSIITIFGATSGGITSIGGGVIAFPVMTLGFTIPPPIARDFCIMCQAVGKVFIFQPWSRLFFFVFIYRIYNLLKLAPNITYSLFSCFFLSIPVCVFKFHLRKSFKKHFVWRYSALSSLWKLRELSKT